MTPRCSLLVARSSIALSMLLAPAIAGAQEPAAWGETLRFSTFSIAAIDPRTG